MPLVRTSALCATALLFACSVGCESQTPPADAPKQYAQLVRVAAAQAEGRPDTSFFWLSNTSVTEARTLMLDLGIDYLRYDRSEGVLCAWRGEGLWPARGYVSAPGSRTLHADSVGALCNIEGQCLADMETEEWMRFRCD